MKPKAIHISIVSICAALVATLAASCDLLQTRSPESPLHGGSTFRPPTSPDIVIDNLKAAVAEKDRQNYMRCLADSTLLRRAYEFVPTIEARAHNPGVFEDWTLFSEEQYFKKLSESNSSGTSRVDFDGSPPSRIADDEVLYTARYHLIFQHQNSSIAQEARGTAQFYIARDNHGTWSIYRWVDLRGTSDVTWSDFKASFR